MRRAPGRSGARPRGAEAAGSGAGGPVSRGGGAASQARYPGAGPGRRGEAWWPAAPGAAPAAGRAGKPAGAAGVCCLYLPGVRGSPPCSLLGNGKSLRPFSEGRAPGARLAGERCLGSSRAGQATAAPRLPGGHPSGFIPLRLGQCVEPPGSPHAGEGAALPSCQERGVPCGHGPGVCQPGQGWGGRVPFPAWGPWSRRGPSPPRAGVAWAAAAPVVGFPLLAGELCVPREGSAVQREQGRQASWCRQRGGKPWERTGFQKRWLQSMLQPFSSTAQFTEGACDRF